MHRKLTITLEDKIYQGLHRVIGRRKISQFIEKLVRPHVVRDDIAEAYREMAQDEAREAEALEWAEGTLRDRSDEER